MTYDDDGNRIGEWSPHELNDDGSPKGAGDSNESWTDALGIGRRYSMNGKDYWLGWENQDALNADPMYQGGWWGYDPMATTPEGYLAVPLDQANQTLANYFDAAGLNKMSGLDKVMKAGAMTVLGVGLGGAAMGAAGLGGAAAGTAGSGMAAADAAGLAQMGQAAGLSGAGLDAFVASGGALGSTAAGGGGIGLGALAQGGGSSGLGTGLEGFTGYDVAYGSPTNASGALQAGADSMIGTGAGSDYLGYATNGLLSAPVGAGGAAGASGGGAAGSLIPGVSNNLLLGGLQAGLGYLGSNAQADAYKDVANQSAAYGAPARARLEAAQQPGFSMMSLPGYEDAVNRAADIATRQWSARAGNPAGNPTAQAGIYRDVLNERSIPDYFNYLGLQGQHAGLGLNTSGAASLAGANQASGASNAIQFGLNTMLAPQLSDAEILRKYGLTIGGVSQK